MSTTASTTTQPTLASRVCLDSLPTEVKLRIAELCLRQDEWWREYDEHIQTQFADADAVEVARFRQSHDVQGERYGRSLSSLAQTSQAWAELTAPLRFRVVKASRANRPVFRRRIVRRRANHFQELHLDEADTEKFGIFLAFLPDFVNIKKLVIGNKLSAEFCERANAWPWYCHDEMLEFSHADIERLIKQVESLSYNVPWRRLSATLKAAPTLTSFSLRIEDATTVVATLSTILATIQQLSTLAVDATGCEVDFGSLTSPSQTTWPTLTSLVFKAERFNPSFATFLLHHQASLRHLRLEWTEGPAESDDATFTFPPSSICPALRTLEIIDCGTSPLFPFLNSINSSNVPALRELRVVPRFGDPLDEDSGFEDSGMHLALRSLFRRYEPGALSVRYYDSERCLLPLCAMAACDMSSDLNIRLDMHPVSPYPRPVFYLPDEYAELKDLELFEQSVSETIDFLASWHQRVKQSRSTNQYGHLASALKLAELERVAQTA